MAIKITEWKDLLKLSPPINAFVTFSLGAIGIIKALEWTVEYDAVPYIKQYGWWLLPGLIGVVLYDRFRGVADDRRDADDCLDSCVYVVTSKIRLYDELFRGENSVVRSAQKSLMIMGSRSRDEGYLKAIEDHVSANPNIEHARILVGPAYNAVLEVHIQKLLEIAKRRNESNGDGRLVVSEFPLGGSVPERFVAASETKAVITLPSLNGGPLYDTALVIEDDIASQKLCGILATMAFERDADYAVDVEATSEGEKNETS